jgi:hypothetical protein
MLQPLVDMVDGKDATFTRHAQTLLAETAGNLLQATRLSVTDVHWVRIARRLLKCMKVASADTRLRLQHAWAPLFSSAPFPVIWECYLRLSKMARATDVDIVHGGITGIAGLLEAHPRDMASPVPQALHALLRHVRAGPPLRGIIQSSVSSFKKSHVHDWDGHKAKLSAELATSLVELFVSPSYYA